MDTYWLRCVGCLFTISLEIVHGNILFEAQETKLCSYQFDGDGNIGMPSCFLNDLSFTVGVEVDVTERILFFSDINEGTMRRVNIGDGAQEVEQIFHSLGSVEDIAVDWVAHNLYWTDFQLGHVCVSRYDGSRRAILLTGQAGPRSIVVYPQKAFLFWTNVGDTLTAGNIMRSDLSGGNERAIVEGGLSSPNGLAIDFPSNRLYFADRGTEKIESVNLGGNQRNELYEAANSDFFDLTIFNGFLYTTRWSSSDTDGYVTAVEYPIPYDASFVPEVTEISKHDGKALGIATFEESRQPVHGYLGEGQCGSNNGGCDHLCLPTTGSNHACQCATGFTLADDEVSCQTDVINEDFLLFLDSSLSTIFQGHLNDTSMLTLSAVNIPEVAYPIDVAFDPVEGKVYWTDRATKTVNRARLDGSEYEIVAARGVEDPSGIDLDVIRRQVFWVDEDVKTINVINMDLTGQEVVIDGGLDEPRALTVNPLSGEIFWSDWGQRAKIEKANMDGSDRRTIVSTGLGWPNGITIDVQANEIFWCDAQNDLIETSNLDGSNRKVVAYLEDTAHPFGLAVSTTDIYWSDWTTRAVYRINRGDGYESILTKDEDVFLKIQGMSLSTVSYDPNAPLPTPSPKAPITDPVPGDGNELSSNNTVILISAAVGGGLVFLAIVIIATLIVCKCNKKSPSSLENHRATENHAMEDRAPPYQTYPGQPVTVSRSSPDLKAHSLKVNMPLPSTPNNKLGPQQSIRKGGDPIYEDLDGYKMDFDADNYLNPAFLKDQEEEYTGLQTPVTRQEEYTGLKTLATRQASTGVYMEPSPQMTPKMQHQSSPPTSAYYLDLHEQPPENGGSYMDLRSNPPNGRQPIQNGASIQNVWPPQSQRTSQTNPPKPPASPRPSMTSVTANWSPAQGSPRVSGARPPPSPRISVVSAGHPPPRMSVVSGQPPPPSPRISVVSAGQPGRSPRISATRPPVMHRPPPESNYMVSLGPAPVAPGYYESAMH